MPDRKLELPFDSLLADNNDYTGLLPVSLV